MLWREVTGSCQLRPDERRVLEDACREADLIDDLHASMAGEPKTVRGSQGQQVIHPLISELRQHRATLNTLLRGLELGKSDTGAVDAVRASSEAAVALARQRWNMRKSS